MHLGERGIYPIATDFHSLINTHSHTDIMNGWANWETWCASLWINNDETLYRTARIYGHSGYDRLVPYLQVYGDYNGDGLHWEDDAIDRAEMDEMLEELCCTD